MDRDVGKDGLWRLAIVIDGDQLKLPFEQLHSSPMRLLAWFSPPDPAHQGEETALAVAKISLLDTFDNVHEYQTKKGVQLRAASAARCCYPHVTLAAYSCMEDDARDMLLMNLPDDQSVERHTGLSRPTSPAILLASSSFLTSQGYSHLELVWVKIIRPLSLERVVLSGGTGGTFPLTPTILGDTVQQLSDLLGKETTVILRQGTTFSLTGSFPRAGEEEKRHGKVELVVMEVSPVLQGRLTRETEVVVVPKVMGDISPPPLTQSGKSLSLSNLPQPLGESSGLEESGDARSFTASNYSASDFRNDDDDEEAGSTSDPCLEVLTHPELKLHRNYVLVPKQFAGDHELLQYQMVVLEPVAQVQGQGLADMVISTHRPGEETDGSHAAILMWYEGQADLERYLPPPYPGYRYSRELLQSAFVHPHLMYFLFHETLSPSRRFFVTMKTGKGKKAGALPDLPKAKVVTMARVGVVKPERDLNNDEMREALKMFFQQRIHLLMTGDIFSVDIEGVGSVFFRLMETDPRNSQRCDSSCLREISWPLKKVEHFPLPCECPPCPLLPPPPYFSFLLPPGLESPCLSLFSLLLPLLYSHHSLRPPRTPVILLTGPDGVGKTTVVRAVARRVRAQLLELNCYQYCSEAVATAEKRLVADSAKALECAPCLVLFRNIHVIGRDAKKDEPRLAAAFLSFMSYVSEYNKKATVDFPILVVATAPKRAAIPAQVAMEMLHMVEMATPTETQRLAILQGLARDYLTSPSISWSQLARLTAGFVLGDLVSLLSRASHLATTSALLHLGDESEELEMSGVAISQTHLQEALTRLHAAHSDNIGAPKVPDVRWEDVGGLAEAKQEVLDAIQLPLAHPDLFSQGLRRSGVLLYGPPGTGKTLLAKAVATECGVHFMSVKGPELINMYVGQTEENVRDIFARARGAAPCIIFFDELDSIAPSRGKTGDASGVMDRVVSQLLAELDGLQKSEDVFVIGATNRVDLLDSALLRPGRFDRLVYLGISEDIQSRLNILTAITRKFNLGADVDLCDLATRCPSRVTGADLYALCSEALLQAVRQLVQRSEVNEGEESLVVSSEHFNWALSHFSPSVTEAELQRYQKLRQTHKDPS